MSKIYTSAEQLIGNTPLLKASRFSNYYHLNANILVKLESFNPAGSVKDRVALAMIEDGERKGTINKDTVLIEPTSGNTGIGLASVAAIRGYRLILTMPETMSLERQKMVKAYGAEIVLSEGAKGMQGAVDKAEELHKKYENSIIVGQFVNPANPMIHYQTTGPEIWNDTDGQVDIFVAGVGTGGTLSGSGKYLKEHNPQIKVVAVEPATSPLLSAGHAGPHKIQGIGANFIPDTLDRNIYDEVIDIENEKAFEMGGIFGKLEGILIGISGGAALAAAVQIAQREENTGKNIVVILPDGGDRYLSTTLYGE